jgi:hypothetical protein
MTLRTRYADIPAWRTLDGSEIRELCHPAVHGNRNQSLGKRPGCTYTARAKNSTMCSPAAG